MDKPLDPGKLDHIVAGGVPAGLSPAETLLKEAAEEAAIPKELASQCRSSRCMIGYAMERPEGLRRDWLHCYDLMLQADFTPAAGRRRGRGVRTLAAHAAVDAVRDTDDLQIQRQSGADRSVRAQG